MGTITPIVFVPLTVMAKPSGFAVAGPITRHPSRGNAASIGATSSFASVSGIGDPEKSRGKVWEWAAALTLIPVRGDDYSASSFAVEAALR